MNLKTWRNRALAWGLVCLTSCSFEKTYQKPEGWLIAGDHPFNYKMGLDPGSGRTGGDASTVVFTGEKARGFGTLSTTLAPQKFLGKRVRMRGFLKTKDVKEWAGFWLRIDEKNSRIINFDNMKDGLQDRSIKGNTDWTPYEIVLDVPTHADVMAYGALLVGKGQIWFEDIRFEAVDDRVATTGISYENELSYPEQVHLDSMNKAYFDSTRISMGTPSEIEVPLPFDWRDFHGERSFQKASSNQ